MYDVIIVGGGPAGLTAANYANRKGLQTLLVSQDLGGKINFNLELPHVDDQPVIRGVDLVEALWQELDELSFARRLEPVKTVLKEDALFTVLTDSGEALQAKCVILATGSRVQRLDVPGEGEFVGRGLSYSATSYASLFAERRAAVIGDAGLALRAVAELALVAARVDLIVPAPTHDVMESPTIQKLVSNANVVIWEGYTVIAIEGSDFARQIVLRAQDNREYRVETDGVFMELGLIPNSDAVRDIASLDAQGAVIVDCFGCTSCPGLFAAGDVTNVGSEQVLIAVGEGAKAALSAYDYLLLST